MILPTLLGSRRYIPSKPSIFPMPFWFFASMACVWLAAAPPEPLPGWQDDYSSAIREAREHRKFLLVWFYDPHSPGENDAFAALLAQPPLQETIKEQFVPVALPLDAEFAQDGERVVLLDHSSFAELRRQRGLAIIDLTEHDSPHFGRVVSVYPFTRQPISAQKLAVLLDLPQGSLTQRTLIFAIRSHPEQPASAASHLSLLLSREAQSHSEHQSRLALQGHHHWNARFHSINAQLGGGLVSREICAESWPGQPLLEAALECVESWRQSPGHWDAVSRRHALFAYDMKRGTSGVWYATGLFAD
jgi:hypothetical protein